MTHWVRRTDIPVAPELWVAFIQEASVAAFLRDPKDTSRWMVVGEDTNGGHFELYLSTDVQLVADARAEANRILVMMGWPK